MYNDELDRRLEAMRIQKGYRQMRKETDDKMSNLLPRESVYERRARIEALYPK